MQLCVLGSHLANHWRRTDAPYAQGAADSHFCSSPSNPKVLRLLDIITMVGSRQRWPVLRLLLPVLCHNTAIGQSSLLLTLERPSGVSGTVPLARSPSYTSSGIFHTESSQFSLGLSRTLATSTPGSFS